MMNRLYQFAWFFVLTGILAHPAASAQTAPKLDADVTPAEYEVFSSYISAEFTGKAGIDRVGDVSRIIIENETKSDQDDDLLTDDDGRPITWAFFTNYLLKEAPALRRDTLQAFRRIQRRSDLQRAFQLPVDYQLVAQSDVDAIFNNGGWWNDYYHKFPNSQGLMRLSRVGFSHDQRQAMFYVVNRCGGKCGTGSYVVMEKRNSTWTVVKEIILWIS